MKFRSLDVIARRPRHVMLACVTMAAVVLVGCLSTWEFRSEGGEVQIIDADGCPRFVDLDYVAKWGDTLTFKNHFGDDVVLGFPDGTVNAPDEDASKGGIQVTVKKWKKKRITIADDPAEPDSVSNYEMEVMILDPCQGGARIIIQPANS